jgi:hypothetical protein
MNIRQAPPRVVLCLLLASLVRADLGAESSDLGAQLEAAKQKVVTQPEYELRHKFSPKEVVRWKVVHLGTTETEIRGNTVTSKSRSVSTKLWRVTDVDEEGNITITHSVESVDMWQKLSDRPEVRYDSTKDEKAPPEYQHVAKTVGQPLTTVTIRGDGTILERESDSPHVKFGLGDIVVRLPSKAIRVGDRWHEQSEIRVRLPDARVKRIKTRKLYTLEKVLTGVATISVKTEVLTPVNDASVKAQLVQQLTQGTIKFDVDAGRIISQQMDWDEMVVGFNGADSMMKYLARFTEELLPAESTVAKGPPPTADGQPPRQADDPPTARAARSDKPALRRR